MKAINFLSITLLWGVAFVLVVFLLVDPSEELLAPWQRASNAMKTLLTLFQFADHWNCIALTFFISASVIVLCLNDLLLMKLLQRYIIVSSLSFWKGGLLWLIKTIINLLLFLLEIVVLCYLISITYGSPRITEAEQIRQGKYTVLLLGTSKFLQGSFRVNRYYAARLQTCLQLYHAGVMSELIISGDSASSRYDEPATMYKDLKLAGLHEVRVKLDKKGYRTFDSIKRLKAMKGNTANELLIISQYFHLQRALYLAGAERVPARGVLAKGSMTWKMFERELLAKTKVLLDIYVFNMKVPGIVTKARRQVNLYSAVDVSLLGFVLSLVAIAGRMTRSLLDY